jgi:DNA-binding ferritin-like protein (Dps family)
MKKVKCLIEQQNSIVKLQYQREKKRMKILGGNFITALKQIQEYYQQLDSLITGNRAGRIDTQEIIKYGREVIFCSAG